MPTLREQLRNLSTYEECEQMVQFIEAEISAARREAYLRCLAQVELAEESDGGSFLEPLINNFRKWANEADGGAAPKPEGKELANG